jgi:ATP-binding cassette subfamily B protein
MAEVVQTSAMDCGPAVLKCLLEGFGTPAHYGRLREACQTDVDGTSIDALEAVAGQLGLDAEQVMLPVDHLLLPEAEALPAVLVVRLANGFTHFVLVWRRHGPFVQVMDPGVGRRWVRARRLADEAYVHTQRLTAAAWRDWAASEDFGRPVARRLRDLGAGRSAAVLLDKAALHPGWRALARLDAATRFVEALVRAGGLRRGREARGVLHTLLDRAAAEAPADGRVIPEAYWSVRPAPAGPEGDEQVLVRGAVLIRVCGRKATAPAAGAPGLSPELARAVAEPREPAGRTFRRLLGGRPLAWAALAVGLLLSAGGTALEALLLRGAIDLGHDLRPAEQRLQAVGCLLLLAGGLLLLEARLVAALLRLGRRLEGRLRLAFLEKIPRLNDRYFQSRPVSDMAERGHSIQQVRLLPRLAGQFARAAAGLAVTAAAVAWIDPAHGPVAVTAAVLALGLPLAFNGPLQELDLRVRNHNGALGRFYLDALLGLAAVRAHGAEPAVRREHEALLGEWVRASRRFLGWAVAAEGLQALVGFGLAGWLVVRYADGGAAAGTLLLAYWALQFPALGDEAAGLARQYPTHRNVTLRLLEPLGAPEEPADPSTEGDPGRGAGGVAVAFDRVTVRAAGHVILDGIEARIAPGEHVAVVGASGAGKSSLIGLLLGWHRPAAGGVHIDGEPLDAGRLERLRGETAWVDPAVQVWNRSLADNLLYGTPDAGRAALGTALGAAELHDVLQRLPDGLQSPLGDGGGQLSGGEGQRVRLARALLRSGARLVLLDEPFRGLDRDRRRGLLRRARRLWCRATLLCVTHDVGDTLGFGRVLVIEAGRIVEDGPPAELARDPGSRYRALLEAEQAVTRGLWSGGHWRRLRLRAGQLFADKEEGLS